MKNSEYLEKAMQLIADESKWTRGAYARDANGEELEGGMTPGAVCWCAIGAIEAVTGQPDGTPVMQELVRHLDRRVGRLYGESIETFNDSEDVEHKNVLQLFEDAVYWAKKDEAK